MTKKVWITIGIVVLLLLIFFDTYIRHDHPSFFIEVIEDFKNDASLMASIGGYKSFEYEFNKNELEEDTLNFTIILVGKEKELSCVGKAVKDQYQHWIIVEKETIIKSDF